MKVKYKHYQSVHNDKNPNIIVPEIIKLLNPKSVVDIGCGIGTFLNAFKRFGVEDVLGVDGKWVDENQLHVNINPSEFMEWDLENKLSLSKKYDLVVSLEVAEHLSSESANIFVQSLVNSGNLILFSAAIPYQGGLNHINEQWLTYWEEKFLKYDFVIHDIIRPMFWDNPEIFVWYKQNMVLIAPREFKIDIDLKSLSMRNIVHPEIYEDRQKNLMDIVKGRKKTLTYLKYLIFSVFGYDNLNKIKSLFRN